MSRLIYAFCIVFLSSSFLFAQKDTKNDDSKNDNKDGKKEKHEKQVLDNEKKLVDFFKKSMIDSIANLYSTNCYYAHEFMTRLESRDEVKKKLKDDFGKGFKVLDLTFSSDDMKSYSDVIMETGILTIKYIVPVTKVTVTKKYNYNLVWKESADKKYRIRSEIWTPVENPCK